MYPSQTLLFPEVEDTSHQCMFECCKNELSESRYIKCFQEQTNITYVAMCEQCAEKWDNSVGSVDVPINCSFYRVGNWVSIEGIKWV